MTPSPAFVPLEGVTAIEASAGTGKTFTIEQLYLRLVVEEGLDVAAILVVTYTKAATAELRRRIRNRLVAAMGVLRTGGHATTSSSRSPRPHHGSRRGHACDRSGPSRSTRRRSSPSGFSVLPSARLATSRSTPSWSGSGRLSEVVDDFWRRVQGASPGSCDTSSRSVGPRIFRGQVRATPSPHVRVLRTRRRRRSRGPRSAGRCGARRRRPYGRRYGTARGMGGGVATQPHEVSCRPRREGHWRDRRRARG